MCSLPSIFFNHFLFRPRRYVRHVIAVRYSNGSGHFSSDYIPCGVNRSTLSLQAFSGDHNREIKCQLTWRTHRSSSDDCGNRVSSKLKCSQRLTWMSYRITCQIYFGIIYCWLFNWSFVLLILVQNFKDFFSILAAKFFNLYSLYYLFYFSNIPLSVYSLMTIYNNTLNLSKKTIFTNNTEIFIILEEMEIGYKLFHELIL